jgi:hypothetical protein
LGKKRAYRMNDDENSDYLFLQIWV